MINLILNLEVTKYIFNGLVATAAHFFVLYILINWFMFESYGISNTIGFVIGTIVSFFGNKYFVFIGSKGNFFKQYFKFFLLYTIMALNHGFFLYLWSDIYNKNYIIGFILITSFNTILSFLVNKYKVFK